MSNVEEVKHKRTIRPLNIGGGQERFQQLRDQEDMFDAECEKECIKKAEEMRVDIDGDDSPPPGDDVGNAISIGIGVIVAVSVYIYLTAEA